MLFIKRSTLIVHIKKNAIQGYVSCLELQRGQVVYSINKKKLYNNKESRGRIPNKFVAS